MHSITYTHNTLTCIHSCKQFLFFQLDIDECSNLTHNCSQICTHTNGSIICECNIGFLLDIDGATCNGMYKENVVLFGSTKNYDNGCTNVVLYGSGLFEVEHI